MSDRTPKIRRFDVYGSSGYADLAGRIAAETGSFFDPSDVWLIAENDDVVAFREAVEKEGGNAKHLHAANPKEVDGQQVPFCLQSQQDTESLINLIHHQVEDEEKRKLRFRTIVGFYQAGLEKYLDVLLRRCPELTYYCVNLNGEQDEQGKVLKGIKARGQQAAPLFHAYDQMKSAPVADFIIEDFLQAQAVTLIAALASHGKTWLLIDLVRALLTGEPFCGHFKVLKPASRVIYLIPEVTAAAAYKRFCVQFHLDDYIKRGQLLISTLSVGRRITLDDPELLEKCPDADVILDTLPRFREAGANENDAVGNQLLAENVFALQAAGARSVIPAQHSPKSFEKERIMTLENVVRGSGDIGAMVATAWGLRRVTAADDQQRCLVYVQNVKPRDFLPPEPFLLRLRPDIDRHARIRMEEKPGECGTMAEEMNLTGPDKKAWAKNEWQKNPKIGRDKLNKLIKDKFGKGAANGELSDWLREWKNEGQGELATPHSETGEQEDGNPF
jgi:hypothetical protein